jgi:hypothetical protein
MSIPPNIEHLPRNPCVALQIKAFQTEHSKKTDISWFYLSIDRIDFQMSQIHYERKRPTK